MLPNPVADSHVWQACFQDVAAASEEMGVLTLFNFKKFWNLNSHTWCMVAVLDTEQYGHDRCGSWACKLVRRGESQALPRFAESEPALTRPQETHAHGQFWVKLLCIQKETRQQVLNIILWRGLSWELWG